MSIDRWNKDALVHSRIDAIEKKVDGYSLNSTTNMVNLVGCSALKKVAEGIGPVLKSRFGVNSPVG